MKNLINKFTFSSNDVFKAFKKSPYRSIKISSYFNSYQDVLEKYRNKQIIFVEIGVLNGGSLFMWREYFGPKARIIGIDLNPIAKKWEKDGFQIYIGSQSDPMFWRKFFRQEGRVDIILDDGGHTNEQQIITAHETIPNIKDGGLLIVEDVHTSYMRHFGNPSRMSFIEWSKEIINNINSRFPGIHNSDLPYKKFVHSIQFFESIVCFHIDRMKCADSKLTANKGISANTIDFRHKNSLPEKYSIKNPWILWLYFRFKEYKLKKYF
jgi:hypothetical protein